MHKKDFKTAKAIWGDLANSVRKEADLGLIDSKVANSQAECYLRVVRALEIEEETGIAVCSCCFKPFGEGSRILIR